MYRLFKVLILLFLYTGQVSLAQSAARTKKPAARTTKAKTAIQAVTANATSSSETVSWPIGPTMTTPTGPLTGVPSPMITPTSCPPGVLPQYCQQQLGFPSAATCGVLPNTSGCVPSSAVPTASYPYGCLINTYQCQTTQYQMAAGGCTSGLTGIHCGSTPWTESLRQQMNPQPQMPLLNPPPTSPGGIGGPLSSMMGAPGAYMGGDRIASGGYGGGNPGGQPAGPYTTSNQVSAMSNRGTAAVVEPVKKWLPYCTQKIGLGTCSFRNDGIWGDASHMARRSCHNIGQAWDIGLPLNCSGENGKKQISPDNPKAMELAQCLANDTGNTFGIIFRDVKAHNMFPSYQRGNHYWHIHVQLKTCPY